MGSLKRNKSYRAIPPPIATAFGGFLLFNWDTMKTLSVVPSSFTVSAGFNQLLEVAIPANAWGEYKYLNVFLQIEGSKAAHLPGPAMNLVDAYNVNNGLNLVTAGTGVPGTGALTWRINLMRQFVRIGDSVYLYDYNAASQNQKLYQFGLGNAIPIVFTDIIGGAFASPMTLNLGIFNSGALYPMDYTVQMAQAWIQSPYNLKRIA